MEYLTYSLFGSLCTLSIILGFYFYRENKNLNAIFCFGFAFKVLLFFIMETGLKYTFVLDSLKYEMDAWNLVKAEISHTQYILEAFEKAEYLNLFTRIMLNVFLIFGKAPEIVTLLNIFFSLGIYYFCIGIALLLNQQILNQQNRDIQKNKTVLLLGLVLFIYPSLNIWSVTNTKDPASIFFLVLGLYMLIKMKSENWWTTDKLRFLVMFALALFSIYVSQLFRPYILPIISSSFALGSMIFLLRKKMSLKLIFIFIFIAATLSMAIFEYTQPGLFQELCKTIYKSRAGFLNEDWVDDISKSAFLVNYSFHTTVDFLLFLPRAVAYYFFGPFIWEVSSLSEALGLIEVLFIVLLIKPFIHGFKILNNRRSYEFNILLSIFFLLTVSQSFIVSNMGTIFRHRTMCLLIFIIIASMGFQFDKKEV